MTGMLTWLLKGVVLGLGAAAPIGPVNVQIARRVLRNGIGAGFALGCGACTVDVAYALLSSLSLGAALARPAVELTLGIAGGLLLAYLGILSIQAARYQARLDPADPAMAAPPPSSLAGHYGTGLLMTLTNPMTLAFWFVGVPGTVGSAAGRGGLTLVAAGVFIGTLVWVTFFATFVRVVARGNQQRWLVGADLLGGLSLLAFAAVAIWRVGVRLL